MTEVVPLYCWTFGCRFHTSSTVRAILHILRGHVLHGLRPEMYDAVEANLLQRS